MFCPKCGSPVYNEAKFCEECGYKLVNDAPEYRHDYSQPPVKDYSGSFLLWLVGFFIPLVGLILYLCIRNDEPGKASSAGKGALTAFVIHIALIALYFFGVAVFSYYAINGASGLI